MSEEIINTLISNYTKNKINYDEFSKKINALIDELLTDESIQCHSINGRSKDIDSLRKKISKPEKNYQQLTDITDLCGIRIITYFSNDVDNVAKIIEKEFIIDRKNSIDKRHENDPDRFGYLSLHYVAQLNNKRHSLPEYKKFKEMKFEIQIRSILQHAWAEIEHDIGYKSELALPREFRRRFARVSGLLEIADNEFNELRIQLSKYKKSVEKQISSKSNNLEINFITLKKFIETNETLINLENKIASDLNLIFKEPTNEVLEGHIKRLSHLKIKTLGEISTLINIYFKEIPKLFIEFSKSNKENHLKPINHGFSILYLSYLNVLSLDDYESLFNLLKSFAKFDDKILLEFSHELTNSYKKIKSNL